MTDLHHPLPDTVFDGDIAILGRKGGGKTFTGKSIVEYLLELLHRVPVLDPLGVWAELRTSADSKAAGYPIAIFGGEFGNLTLDTAAAARRPEMSAPRIRQRSMTCRTCPNASNRGFSWPPTRDYVYTIARH